jgi:hypothetical protein
MTKVSKNYQGCSFEQQAYFGKLKFTNKEALKKLSRVQFLKTIVLWKNEINKQVR